MKLNLSICGENREEIIKLAIELLSNKDLSYEESNNTWLYYTNSNNPNFDFLSDNVIDPNDNKFLFTLQEFIRRRH